MDSYLEKKAEVTLPRHPLRFCGPTIIWIVAANTGLLTTKYLLTHGYNYPLHLLLTHLATAIALEIICLVVSVFVHPPGTTCSSMNGQSDGGHHLLRGLITTGYLITTAAATMMGYQALEHFGTFPAVVTTLMCVALPWEIRNNRPDGKTAGLITILVISLLSIYTIDAKLTFKGVGSAALAAGFAIASKIQKSWLDSHSSNQAIIPTTTSRNAFNLAAFILALAVTSLCCLRWETPIYSPMMSYAVRWIFVLNICSSALAFKLGGSTFWFFHTFGCHERDTDPPARLPPLMLPAWTAMALTSLASTVFHIGFPMDKAQYVCCFIMMETLLAMQRHGQPSCHQRYNTGDCDAAQESLLHSENGSMDHSENGRNFEANVHPTPPSSPERRARGRCTHQLQVSMVVRATLMLVMCFALMFFERAETMSLPKEPGNHIRDGDDISRSFDLIVSYYDESLSGLGLQLKDLINVPALSSLNISITVYNKGNSTKNGNLKENLTRLTGLVPEVIHRPNVGKEAETYLHHIVSKWDSLAHHTFFMQADMHNLLTSRQRINQYFVLRTGFLPLSPIETCDSFDGCTDHSTWSEESGILKRIFNEANIDQDLEALLLIYRGQFIASSSRIRGSGQEHYLSLLTELQDRESYTHSKAYADRPWMPGKTDTMPAPLFGYTVERMWPAILGCSPLRIARHCPSLASGLVQSFMPWYTVNLEDCQCLDIPYQ